VRPPGPPRFTLKRATASRRFLIGLLYIKDDLTRCKHRRFWGALQKDSNYYMDSPRRTWLGTLLVGLGNLCGNRQTKHFHVANLRRTQ
jgi:hypothetical protein